MGHNIGVVKEDHSVDQIINEGGDKHVVQVDVRVFQNIFERPLVAKVGDQSDTICINTRTDETEIKSGGVCIHIETCFDLQFISSPVDVVVSQFSHNLHLFHHVPRNVFPPFIEKLFDFDF